MCNIVLEILLPLFIAALTASIGLSVYGDLSREYLGRSYAVTSKGSRFMPVTGGEVHFRDDLPGGVPTDTWVLIHGFGASLHIWEGWVPTLTSRAIRVVRMDMPGFGLTGPLHRKPAYTYGTEEAADFLHAFLGQVGVLDNRLTIVGNSLGGAVAWQFALRYPNLVKQLILINAAVPTVNWVPMGAAIGLVPGFQQMIRWATPYWMVGFALAQSYGDPSTLKPAVVYRFHTLARHTGNREAWVDMLRTVIDYEQPRLPSYRLALQKLDVPTLVLVGGKDRVIQPSLGSSFCEKRSVGCEVHTWPNLGHFPMEESPEETIADVLTWLRTANA